MLFLISLFKPETWLSENSGIMGAIVSGLRTLLFNITTIAYELIVNVYNLFEKLCNARILDNDIIEVIGNRVGLVLGLVMFFYIIFGFIQMMLDPDKITDKEKGATQIAKKAIIVVVMLGVSNIVFDMAFGIQRKIIESNVIEKILLPYNIQTNDGSELDNFGNILSVNLLKAFYYIDDNLLNGNSEVTFKDDSAAQVSECEVYTNAFYNQVYQHNKYDLGYVCLNQSVNITRTTDTGTIDDQVYIINFNGIIAPLVGGYTVYLLLMYCFKIGVRMIQLAFLEIISPMAIISYLSLKKDNMFTKWWKIYFSTYIDVFIRIAIINLMVFLICTIFAG